MPRCQRLWNLACNSVKAGQSTRSSWLSKSQLNGPTLKELQQRIIARMIQSAEQSGISLKGKDRERFNAIEQELTQLSTDYSNHLLDATGAFQLDLIDASDAEGLPASLRRMTAAAWSRAEENKDKPASTADAGPWRITLDHPCFGPFMEHCRKRAP